jgi:RimJ/RimL family protein N-acetyltransferase
VPLTHELLLLYKNDPQQLAKELSVQYLERQHDPATINDVMEATDFWINSTLAYPHDFEWFTSWEIIVKEEAVAIGGIGFAGLPDEDGKSMVGYGLDMRYHKRGYATEALKAILEWGFKNPQLKCVIADTALKHTSSQNVLIKNGFQESGRSEHFVHWYLNR